MDTFFAHGFGFVSLHLLKNINILLRKSQSGTRFNWGVHKIIEYY
jgi:hypothetical protein